MGSQGCFPREFRVWWKPMGVSGTLPHVRCLSCGLCPDAADAAPISLRSQSERYAFAHCPHCNCLRMMSLERHAGRARKEALVAAAGAAS